MKASARSDPQAKPARLMVEDRWGRVMTKDVIGHIGRPSDARQSVLNDQFDGRATAAQIPAARRESIRDA